MAGQGKKLPMRTEREKDALIIQLMSEGYAPSAIDEELRLDKGYTHDFVKSIWLSGNPYIFERGNSRKSKTREQKHRPLTETQKRDQAIHRKAKQQNSVVAKRYAGRNLERQNPWSE